MIKFKIKKLKEGEEGMGLGHIHWPCPSWRHWTSPWRQHWTSTPNRRGRPWTARTQGSRSRPCGAPYAPRWTRTAPTPRSPPGERSPHADHSPATIPKSLKILTHLLLFRKIIENVAVAHFLFFSFKIFWEMEGWDFYWPGRRSCGCVGSRGRCGRGRGTWRRLGGPRRGIWSGRIPGRRWWNGRLMGGMRTPTGPSSSSSSTPLVGLDGWDGVLMNPFPTTLSLSLSCSCWFSVWIDKLPLHLLL